MGPQALAMAGPLATVVKATLRAASRHAGEPQHEDAIRTILQRACRELDHLAKPS
jgi:hypothetical protein